MRKVILALAVIPLVFLLGCNTSISTTTIPTSSKTTVPNKTSATNTTTTTPIPSLDIKEISSGIYTNSDWPPPRKQFFFTYFTNQSRVLIKFISPDGYFREPFWAEGPGEMKARANIPPQDVGNTEENRFMDDAWASVALPGTYKMVVYSPDRLVLSTKDFTFKGAKLVLEEAKISKWTWQWSLPVCQLFPKEMSVTVSNKGDLPTFASVSLGLDNKNIGLVDLGYVDSGAVRTFTFPSPYYMIVINYKNPGEIIPPSSHAFSAYLVSKIPQSADD